MTIPTYSDFVVNLAKHLATLGIGQWADDGIYTNPTLPPIYWGIIDDKHQYGIGLQVYHDDTTLDNATRDIRVQILARGDRHPGSPAKILDRIFTAMHDESDWTLNNRQRVLLSRQDTRPAASQDANKTWSQPANWVFTLNP